MKKTLFTLLASMLGASLSFAGTPMAPPAPITTTPVRDWEAGFVLYGWGTSLDGQVGVGGLTSDVDVGFDDILDNLDGTFLGAFGFRKGRVGALLDITYLDISTSSDTPGALFSRADLSLQQFMVDLKGSYRVLETENSWIDLLAGARYYDLESEITLQPGRATGRSAGGSEGWWDAIGGVRAQCALTDRLFFTFLADIGGGSSDYTLQAMAGLGYRFTDTVHTTLGYRYMDYDYSNGGFAYDVATQGIILGLGFTW